MSYTTFQICEEIDVKRERLREWMYKGFITASINQAKGVGTKNIFSQLDVHAIELFRFLIEVIELSRTKACQLKDAWLKDVLNHPNPSQAMYLEFRFIIRPGVAHTATITINMDMLLGGFRE